MKGTPYTAEEKRILRQAPSAPEAANALPYRRPSGVLNAWYHYNPRKANGPYSGSRDPVTPDERRLAKLLLQMRRITQREHTFVEGAVLLETLREVWKVWE